MTAVNDLLNNAVTRCASCVLPHSITTRGTASSIHFDDAGVCSLCAASNPKTPSATAFSPDGNSPELEEIIQEIRARGANRPYDCLVGVSGGRDSSYLLYLLVKKHGLRCLAAYYRTPFTPSVIDGNVRRMVETLDVPLVEIDISQEYHRRIAGKLVRLWAEKPSPVLANLACAPCKMLSREIFRIARRQQISTIVYGGNQYESFQLAAAAPPISAHANRLNSLRDQFRNMATTAQRGLGALMGDPRLWRYLPLGIQASLFFVNPHTPYLKLRNGGIRAFDYFYMADWNEEEAQIALNELEWTLPADCHTTWRADCDFAEVKNAMFQKTVGVSYLDAYLSNMVRAGVLTRDEALERLATEGRPSPERVANVAAVLEMPEATLSAMLTK